MTNCSTCNAPIFFAKMSTGALTPFDENPTTSGDWVILGRVVTAHTNMAGKTVPAGTPIMGKADVGTFNLRYVTHFATCPSADVHRMPKPRVEKPLDREMRLL